MAERRKLDPASDVSRLMLESRGGQVTVDLEAWVSRLEAFIEAQPGVHGRVWVTDVQRPDTGTAGGNAQFTAEADLGGGRRSHRLVVRYAPPKGCSTNTTSPPCSGF